MDIKEKVLKFIKKNNMLNVGQSVVVGVSGGSDSMCLLNILLSIKDEYSLKLYVVHIHHGIRGKSADEDATFVENFCKNANIECEIIKYDIPAIAKEMGVGEEEAGRIKRYQSFYKKAKQCEGVVAVAHNMMDVTETVIFNMCRGTGAKGMAGIHPARDGIIRPILCLDKSEIYAYLEENNISYRVDQTNFCDMYSRNKIRINVIPYLEEHINEKTVKHIYNMAENMREITEYMERESKKLFDTYARQIKDDGYLLENELFSLDKIVVEQVVRNVIENLAKLKDITRVHVESVYELFNKNTGASVDLPYNLIASKGYEGVVIKKNNSNKKIEKNDFKDMEIKLGVGEYDIPGGNHLISISREAHYVEPREKLYTKWINCDILKDTLSLRKRQAGDYIVVGDNGARKKLKDYFIDIKVPREERDDVWLIASGHEIVWVIGYRIGANYRINEQSENIIRIEYKTRG